MDMANNLVRKDNREVSRPGPTAGRNRWDPFRVMNALLRWDPFSDDFSAVQPWAGVEFTPRFDVKETKDAYVLKADLPGLKDDDVDVSLNGNTLTISGRREEEHKEEGEQYYTMERSYGSFARRFSLPEGVDGEHISADLKNGVLTVHLPKRPEAQPKKISLGAGTGSSGSAKA
jgi:HSP20 family protein